MDAASGLLGGNVPGSPAGNAELKFYKGENLGLPEQNLAGAQAPEDRRPIDAGAIIEFIHIGHVHLDTSKNFHHSPKTDDAVETFPNNAKLRAFQYRAALHREAVLLSSMMTGCQSVLDALEKSKGGIGQMAGMAADMLGAGGAGAAVPTAGEVNAFGSAVQSAVATINTSNATYTDIHQCGIDLQQARCNYRAFQQKLLDPPANDPTGGLLGKIPVLGPAIPSKVAEILNFVTGLAFKPMDVYQHFYVRIAIDLEKSIEKTVRRYTVASLQGPLTPAFYLWYPVPPAPPPAAGGNGGGTGIGFLDDAKKRFDDLKSKVDDFGKKIRDFVEPDPDQPPAPGDAYLQEAFQVAPPPMPANGQPPAPPKELATLILNGFKSGLGVGSLPGFVETVIVEVTTVNNEFLRVVYKKLMDRPAVQPINELEMYEAARMRMLERLVDIVMEKVSFLQTAKDFGINVQGINVNPGEALLDKGMEALNKEVLRRLNVALELTMGELVDKLEGLRQQCESANALAMEAYLGAFPWLLALNFRNTFMPVWQLIMDNTFGRASGPLGDAMRQARDAMNAAKSKVDDARTVAMRLQRIKDRATREGLQAGTGGQNLTGYREDWAATLPPDQVQPKPQTIPFFPFTSRISQSAGEKVTKTEYDIVKGSHKWDIAGDSATA
ncbi:MAG: hypothetical protein ACKV2U_29290 [Bryobacteraceae bacterium]